jgi:hypothetical protein
MIAKRDSKICTTPKKDVKINFTKLHYVILFLLCYIIIFTNQFLSFSCYQFLLQFLLQNLHFFILKMQLTHVEKGKFL